MLQVWKIAFSHKYNHGTIIDSMLRAFSLHEKHSFFFYSFRFINNVRRLVLVFAKQRINIYVYINTAHSFTG